MEGLSIEEKKAKRYDEALERYKAKQEYESKEVHKFIEYIFPELKESEDERIRKALIEMVHDTTSDSLWVDYNVHKEDAIAWLEKQGKNNMGISEATKKELEDNLNKALEKETPESWNKFLDEQGEQKPAEWTMDNIEELTEFENAMMHIGGSFFGEHQGLDPNDTFVVKEQAKILLEMAPKQEWSEEDIKCLNRISLILLDASEVKQWWKEYRLIEKDEMEKLTNWLKSLRPQNTWKPSEEQMKALEEATNEQWDVDGDALWHLYQDLKKLRNG